MGGQEEQVVETKRKRRDTHQVVLSGSYLETWDEGVLYIA